MKKSLLFIFILSTIFIGCKTSKPVAERQAVKSLSPAPLIQNTQAPVNLSSQETWILGYFKADRFYQPPHNTWFLKGFDEYQANQEVIKKLLATDKSNISIKIVMGTWCPDSRREVPRFMRILSEIKFPAEKVQLIGVDNVKVSPIENYTSLNIQRVPTFIFFKNNIEAGRIIENPVTSLEQDMDNILNRNEK
jgi:thiol-disulfide isomerase/thioredoxin